MKLTGFGKLGFLGNRFQTMKQQSRKRNKNAQSIIMELASESNAHGLAKIATSTETSRKVMWVLMVIMGFTAATLQLSLLVRKYLEFQVVEVSKVKDGMLVEFPAITVCNIAPISLTKTKKLLASKTSELRQWLEFIQSHDFAHHSDRIFTVQSLYENLAQEAQYLGRDITDFLIHCRFNQEACSVQNFTRHFDGHYFNCYTFNSGQQVNKLLMHATGPQNGLSLVLSLDNDDPPVGGYGTYNIRSNIEHSAGVRVVVHPPNTMPSPVDHGFDVPPGYSSSIGLKAILHSRLSKPYGNCTNDLLDFAATYRHTIFSCLQLCKQQIIMKTCGCRSSSLPEVNPGNFTFCGSIKNWQYIFQTQKKVNSTMIDLSQLSCENRILKELANNRTYETSCQCSQPCKETSYQKSISLSYWPLEFYQLSALQVLYGNKINQTFLNDAYKLLSYLANLANAQSDVKSTPPSHTKTQTSTQPDEELNPDRILHASLNSSDKEKQIQASNMIRQNLLRLNVYLEDLSVIEFQQMSAYELADLFADIGGTLGLWMGISVLTIMELIELIGRLLMLLFNSENKIPERDPVTNGMLERECDCHRQMESPI